MTEASNLSRDVKLDYLVYRPTIKDSGARREFETGAVRDIQEGKGRCDLLPLDVVAGFANDPILFSISHFMENGTISHLFAVLKECPSRLNFTSGPNMILEVSKHFEEGAKNMENTIGRRVFLLIAISTQPLDITLSF